MWFKQIKMVKEKNQLNEKLGETEKSIKLKTWLTEKVVKWKNGLNRKIGQMEKSV